MGRVAELGSLGHVTRTLKSLITICVLSLLLTACRHVEPEPERRSTESEIRQHIVGEWTAADKSREFEYWYPKLIIARDGKLLGVPDGGTNELIGTWELSAHGLSVTASPARVEMERKLGYPYVQNREYYPVVYVDAHELIMTPGPSLAGRWRYKR